MRMSTATSMDKPGPSGPDIAPEWGRAVRRILKLDLICLQADLLHEVRRLEKPQAR